MNFALERLEDKNQQLHAEIERLEAWKAEALVVLDKWEEVWVALGEPGQLGEFRADAACREAKRLRDDNERLRRRAKHPRGLR